MELKKLKKNRSGFFFTADAILALMILFFIVILAHPTSNKTRYQTEVPADIIKSLSALKIYEVQDNPTIRALIDSGNITNLNTSLIEQIGLLSVTGNEDKAKEIADAFLGNLDFDENVGVWFYNTLLFSKNKTSYEQAKDVDVSRHMISFIHEGPNVAGFSSRAYLSSNAKVNYFYFGGYVGDGNLSVRVFVNTSVKSAEMELVANSNFSLFINNNFAGNFQSSPSQFQPVKYILNETQIDLFQDGENIVDFRDKGFFVAGGYLKVSSQSYVEFNKDTRYFFPGVNGLINIYDAMYVPTTLTTMNISLHMNSTLLEVILNIGNVTVFNGTTNGEETIIINNSVLSSKLNYASLNRKTVPIRIGLKNATYESHLLADVVSVTDMSKYMRCSIFQYGPNRNQCENNGGIWMLPANYSKEANTMLINEILSYQGSRVGLMGMKANINPENPNYPLSNNSVALLNSVSILSDEGQYTANNLRLCAGVTNAQSLFLANWSQNTKAMIILLAGQISVPRCGIATQDLNGDSLIDSKDDAIQAVCDAYNNYSIKSYVVAYGDVVDTNTLLKMNQLCHANYYHQINVTELLSTYQQIIEDIETDFVGQTVTAEGGYSKLYPDSYIDFSYTEPVPAQNLVFSLESKFSDNYTGSFSVPEDSTVLNAEAVSYSGPRWTSLVKFNNNEVYNISKYGSDYIALGDPFKIVLPLEYVNYTSPNIVDLTTAQSPTNQTYGSEHNKIIYTLSKNLSEFSGPKMIAEGCNWNIEFEDNSIVNVPAPQEYADSNECSYNSSTISCADNPSCPDSSDAFQVAVYNLLRNIDTNHDGQVDVLFTQQDLQVTFESVSGLPQTYAGEIQVRRWV